jgi:hypothetical protein
MGDLILIPYFRFYTLRSDLHFVSLRFKLVRFLNGSIKKFEYNVCMNIHTSVSALYTSTNVSYLLSLIYFLTFINLHTRLVRLVTITQPRA